MLSCGPPPGTVAPTTQTRPLPAGLGSMPSHSCPLEELGSDLTPAHHTTPLGLPERGWRWYPRLAGAFPTACPTPPNSFMGLDFSGSQKSFTKPPQEHPQPMRIKIAPSECRGSFYRCPPTEERLDPCAKETMLKALPRCNKGKRKEEVQRTVMV